MNKAKAAALYSALIFPGAGQLWLKEWTTGVCAVGLTGYALYRLMSLIFSVANTIAQQIMQGSLPLNPLTIHQEILKQLAAAGSGETTFPLVLLLIVWLASIADAYRLGLRHERLADQP